MQYFAEIDANNLVKRVIVADLAFIQSGAVGAAANWVETSPTGAFRNLYATVGYTYSKAKDAFIEPKPYTLWVLDATGLKWVAPVAKPVDGKNYGWSEKMGAWKEILPITVCQYPDLNNADFVEGLAVTQLNTAVYVDTTII